MATVASGRPQESADKSQPEDKQEQIERSRVALSEAQKTGDVAREAAALESLVELLEETFTPTRAWATFTKRSTTTNWL